jgi:hypothetical protein
MAMMRLELPHINVLSKVSIRTYQKQDVVLMHGSVMITVVRMYALLTVKTVANGWCVRLYVQTTSLCRATVYMHHTRVMYEVLHVGNTLLLTQLSHIHRSLLLHIATFTG